MKKNKILLKKKKKVNPKSYDETKNSDDSNKWKDEIKKKIM